jgi:acetoin utilization deacetylase AcuC-like enzyme
MKLFVTDGFPLPLPAGHRFPVEKYGLTRRLVEASGLFAPEDFIVPHAATDEELLRVHTPDYLDKLKAGALSESEVRRIGLPWSPELVERSRRSTGATIEACRAALDEGMAASLSGGTHHAFADCGEGFCVFNDAAVAVRAVQAERRAERVVIIDLDVHQGNGTAKIFEHDESVFTFSAHGAKNFPARKETSDLDVELPDGAGDAEYLAAVEQGTWEALHRARADLAIYLAGVDPFEGDRLGRMKVSKAGLARRNEIVFEACSALRLPVAVTMAGGYAHDVNDVAELYCQNVRQALAWSRRYR